MGLHRPVVFDLGVTEITDLLQHGPHESGTKLLGYGESLLTVFISDILPTPCVVVECRESVQELTATLHVPTKVRGVWQGVEST